MLGVFGEIAGLVFGKVNDLSEEEEQTLEQLILAYTEGYDFPILSQVDLGHTDPRLVLPLGYPPRSTPTGTLSRWTRQLWQRRRRGPGPRLHLLETRPAPDP